MPLAQMPRSKDGRSNHARIWQLEMVYWRTSRGAWAGSGFFGSVLLWLASREAVSRMRGRRHGGLLGFGPGRG